MGTFPVTIEIAASEDGPFESLDTIAGSGQMVTCVPSAVLQRLGVEATERQTVIMPDGSREERRIGEPVVRLGDDDRAHPTLVIFGEEGDTTLLGDLTLAAFVLKADPDREELVPLTVYLPSMWPVEDVTTRSGGQTTPTTG